MSHEHVNKTIELVQQQVVDLDLQLLEKKRMVNDLCKLAGREPVYGDAALTASSSMSSTRTDEYYGQPLASVVRTILDKRRVANRGAATVNEIFDEMVAGGYAFAAKNDENAKRGLYISLGKNTGTFHKLPNGTYGLLEWYPDAKDARVAKSNGGSAKQGDKPLHEELQEEADVEDEEVLATKAK